MKKILGFVFAAVLACTAAFALVGCGGSSSDSGHAGTWECTEFEYEGTVNKVEDFGQDPAEYMTVEFAKDGTVTFGGYLAENYTAAHPGAMTWEETDGGVNILLDGATLTTLTDQDGKLKFDMDGEINYFEKQ